MAVFGGFWRCLAYSLFWQKGVLALSGGVSCATVWLMRYAPLRPRLPDTASSVIEGRRLSSADEDRYGMLAACKAAGIDAGVYGVLFSPDAGQKSLRSWQRWYLIQMTDRQIESRRRSPASIDDDGWAKEDAEQLVYVMQTSLGADTIEAALDILSSYSVPLIDLSNQSGGAPEFSVRGWHLDKGEIVGGGRPSTVIGRVPENRCNSSAGVAFAKAWIFHILEVGFKSRRHQVWRGGQDYQSYFLAFAQTWGRDYKSIPRPSQACISYCRDIADGGWKGRAYGESVTTLALERFGLEYAWAKRARYHFGVDRLVVGENYGHAFSRSLDVAMASCRGNVVTKKGLSASLATEAGLTDQHGYALSDMTMPGAVSGYVMGVLGGREDADNTMREARDRMASWGITEAMFKGICSARADANGVRNIDTALGEALDASTAGNPALRNAVPGLIAGAFVEGAHVDPDYYFILSLMLFMEAEAGRTDFALLPRYHPAYRLRVRAGKSRMDAQAAKMRGIMARRAGSVEYLDDHCRFGWFYMGVSRVVPQVILAPLQEAGFLPGLISFGFAVDGRKGLARRVMPARKKWPRRRDAAENAVLSGIMLEMVARIGFWERDTVSWREARYGRSGCHMQSVPVRLGRHAYAMKYRPHSLRKPYVEALSRKNAVFMSMSNSDINDVMGSFLPAEFLDMMARQHRNEYQCGYGVYGSASISAGDAGSIAMETLCKKICAMGRSTMAIFYAMEVNAMTNTVEHHLSEPSRNVMRSLSYLDPFDISARTPQRSSFDHDIVERLGASPASGTGRKLLNRIAGITRRRIVSDCGILAKEVGNWPYRRGLNDYRVFNAWKAEMLGKGICTARNLALSFMLYVARHAIWSRLSWAIIATGGFTDERISQARAADVTALLA